MIGFGKMITLFALIGWGKNMVPAFPIIGKTSLDWSQTSWAQNLGSNLHLLEFIHASEHSLPWTIQPASQSGYYNQMK